MSFSKVYESAVAAVSDIGDGATALVGGTARDSEPSGLLAALAAGGVRGLTVVCDFGGWDGADGLLALARAGCIAKVIAPFPFAGTGGGILHQQWQAGLLDVEAVPQGTLAERLRAAGAGIGGVFLPAGAHPAGGHPAEVHPTRRPTGVHPAGGYPAGAHPTLASIRFAEGKERRTINGVECVLEAPLRADFALLRAARADTLGNLAYRGAQRGWNATMAAAARITIAEADCIGEPGDIDPELVITPGIYVNRIVRAAGGAGTGM